MHQFWNFVAIFTRAAWVGGFLLSILVAMLWYFQEKLLFQPGAPNGNKSPDNNPPKLNNPSEWGLPYDNVEIKTRDGLMLHGWLLRQPDALKAPTFLYFHGNAGNMGYRLPNLKKMYEKVNVNILIISYRGYGNSDGSPTEEGVYTDAEAALDFVLNNSAVNNKDIFAFGRSIGGAVAIELASRREDELKGVVVENTFTSLLMMVYIVFPFLRPFHFIVKAVQRMYMLNDEKVRSLTLPFLFISGRQDKLVPPSHMDSLFESCTSQLKLRYDVEDGDHNDTWTVGGDHYYIRLKEFVAKALAESAAHGSVKDSASHTDMRQRQPVAAGEEREL